MDINETAQTAGERVAANIRRYRLERDLSVAALARASSLSPDAVKRIELGDRRVDVDELSQLAGGLAVTELDLLGYLDPDRHVLDDLRRWETRHGGDLDQLAPEDLEELGRLVGIAALEAVLQMRLRQISVRSAPAQPADDLDASDQPEQG